MVWACVCQLDLASCFWPIWMYICPNGSIIRSLTGSPFDAIILISEGTTLLHSYAKQQQREREKERALTLRLTFLCVCEMCFARWGLLAVTIITFVARSFYRFKSCFSQSIFCLSFSLSVCGCGCVSISFGKRDEERAHRIQSSRNTDRRPWQWHSNSVFFCTLQISTKGE